MAKNCKELQAKMGPERLARSRERVEQMIRDMPLDELREARAMTQEHLRLALDVEPDTETLVVDFACGGPAGSP